MKRSPEKTAPEKRAPESRARPPKTAARPPSTRADAPSSRARPPITRASAPRAPHGRTPEPIDRTNALETVPTELGPYGDDSPSIPYPIFPTFAAGTIDSIRVYRTTSRNNGQPGTQWHQQALPWMAALTTWDDIARICGGGRFVVQAVASGRVISSASRTFDGPARTPGPKDVASISPGLGLAENGAAIYETPNGWVSIPGLDGAAQAAFIAYQQIAFYARDDAHKAIAAMAALTSQLAEKAMAPDPGLAVLESIVEAQRGTIDRLYSELKRVGEESTKLRIENASSGTEEQRVRVEAIRKGMDIVDGAAGAIAQRMLATQTASGAPASVGTGAAIASAGTPTSLGEALAKRALDAVTK